MEDKNDNDSICNWCTQNSHLRIGTGIGGLWNKRTSGDSPNYSIIKIFQNTEESPRDLRRLEVTQTPVRNYQLTLVLKARHDRVGKVIHREMCWKFQFDHTNKWYMHNPAPVLENDSHKLLWDFNIQTDHLIPGRRPDLIIIDKRKRICKIVDFAVPEDHKINLKESEKKDKYFDLARKLKKLWNMKVTILPIVIGALGTITKGLLKGLEDLEVGRRVETIQTTALLRTARILRRVLETWGDLLSLKLQWKTIS